jgi:hypothetical protein
MKFSFKSGFNFTWLILVIFSAHAYAQSSTTFYVSTLGNDDNNGSETSPFATLLRARDAVREINRNMNSDILVYIREGTYFLDETLTLDERDGGTNGYNVVYRSYPEDSVTISGGKIITGWTASGSGVYTAPTSGMMFRQLFVNNMPAVKVRTPEKGSGSAIEDVRKAAGLWGETYMPYLPDGTVLPRCLESWEALKSVHQGPISAYRNCPDKISQHGEWAIDPGVETVYYMPRSGENISTAEIVAPFLDSIIHVKGSAINKLAGNIIFQEIHFAHSGWSGFEIFGYPGVIGGTTRYLDELGRLRWNRHSAGVIAEYSHDIRFEKCEFFCMGGYGVDIARIACFDNALTGCSIHDIAGIGVVVSPFEPTYTGSDTLIVFNPEDTNLYCKNIEISHNSITRCGFDYKGSVAIHAPYPTAVKILHNKVWDLAYSGIIMGWYGEPRLPSALKNNLLRGNYVEDVLKELNDGGEIYTQGPQPGTRIDSNVCVFTGASQVGGNFFYIDVGSSYMTLKHNATIGCSYTWGIGFACTDLFIDSNWCEWSNYFSTNGTQMTEEYRCQLTNQFIGAAPQGLLNNAGPKEIELTPVSSMPHRDPHKKFSAVLQNNQISVFDMRGRRIMNLKSSDLKVADELKKVISPGTYLLRRSGMTKTEKFLIQ